jgi:hypothetical protein
MFVMKRIKIINELYFKPIADILEGYPDGKHYKGGRRTALNPTCCVHST